MSYSRINFEDGVTKLNAANLNTIDETVYNHDLKHGPTAATLIVAASDSLHKQRADYICSGINDEVTIQQAIEARPSLGGLIFLLEGNYSIDAVTNMHTLTPIPHKVTIRGAGKGTKLASSGNFSIFANNANDNTIFEDMYLYGSGGTSVGIAAYSASKEIIVRRCWIDNFYRGVFGQDAILLKVIDCKFNNNIDSAILFYGGEDCEAKGNYSDTDSTNGLSASITASNSAKRIKILGNTVIDAGGTGILLYGPGKGCAVQQNTVVRISVNGVHGIAIENSTKEADVGGNYIDGGRVGADDIGINVSLGIVKEANIHHNTIKNWDRPIWIDEATLCSVHHNLIKGAGSRGVTGKSGIILYKSSDNLIEHNTIKNNTEYGIKIYGTDASNRSDYNKIRFNRCLDDQDQGDELLTSDAAAAQKDVVVADGSVFGEGQAVVIKDDLAQENNWIASISGNTLTMAINLTNAYTVAQNGHVYGRKTQQDGIHESTFADYNEIIGNDVRGNRSGYDIKISGEHTKYANKYSDIFMDVLGISATYIRSNEDLSVGTPITFTIDAQPDVPRTLSAHFDSHTNITEYDIEIVGVDAKGNVITETKDEGDGWDWETNNAFAIITSIKMTSRTGTGAGDTMDIGITDVLGVSNAIYATGDVFKIKKNNANAIVASAQINTTYDTYDMAVIGLAADDDFTIWFRSSLNILSLS